MLETFLVREAEPEDYSDDELDALTSPVKANPFEPAAQISPAAVKKVDPQQKMAGGVIGKKPQNPQATQTGDVSHSKPVPGQNMPNFRGQFFGQAVNMGGQYGTKNVGYDKKVPPQPGQRRVSGGARPSDAQAFPPKGQTQRGFGKVVTKQNDVRVWDGSKWITSAEFDKQYGKK